MELHDGSTSDGKEPDILLFKKDPKSGPPVPNHDRTSTMCDRHL